MLAHPQVQTAAAITLFFSETVAARPQLYYISLGLVLVDLHQ